MIVLCLGQFQLDTSPWQPPGKYFERANPGHPGKFFWSIACPAAKSNGRIPGGGAKFSQTRSSLSLQRILKKLWSNSWGWGNIFPNSKLLELAKNPLKIKKTMRQYKLFLFGKFHKTFIFQTEAKPLESL